MFDLLSTSKPGHAGAGPGQCRAQPRQGHGLEGGLLGPMAG